MTWKLLCGVTSVLLFVFLFSTIFGAEWWLAGVGGVVTATLLAIGYAADRRRRA